MINFFTFLLLILSPWVSNADDISDINALVNKQNSILTVEQAFNPNIYISPTKTAITINFNIQSGYYLYQSKFKYSTKNNESFQVIIPDGVEKEDEFFGKQIIYNQPISIQVNFKNALLSNDEFRIRYQGCSEQGLCYPPQEINLIVDDIDINVMSANNTDIYRNAYESNIFIAFALFFIGGMLLSLTPCVLPLIPVMLGMLANLNKNKSVATIAYVFGICVTYALIGIFAAKTGSVLSLYLQNPLIIAFSSLLFVVFAFAMFDFYDISLPISIQTRLSNKSNSINTKKYLGIFFLGMISSLILSPCVAPPLVSAIIYIGQTGNILIGSVSLFLMALGMSLPLLVIGLSSTQVKLKTGPLSNFTKKLIGFILLATAIYISQPLFSTILIKLSYLILAFVFLLFVFLSLRKYKNIILSIVLILAFAIFFFSTFQLINEFSKDQDNSLIFKKALTNEELNELILKSQQPIIIDFYADWCVACLELEKYTFTHENIRPLLDKFTLIKIDVTEYNQSKQELMQRFNVFGPPSLIFFNSKKQEMPQLQRNGFVNHENFLNLIKDLE
jgi:thiol:disulfide interchange protein DsbD